MGSLLNCYHNSTLILLPLCISILWNNFGLQINISRCLNSWQNSWSQQRDLQVAYFHILQINVSYTLSSFSIYEWRLSLEGYLVFLVALNNAKRKFHFFPSSQSITQKFWLFHINETFRYFFNQRLSLVIFRLVIMYKVIICCRYFLHNFDFKHSVARRAVCMVLYRNREFFFIFRQICA